MNAGFMDTRSDRHLESLTRERRRLGRVVFGDDQCDRGVVIACGRGVGDGGYRLLRVGSQQVFATTENEFGHPLVGEKRLEEVVDGLIPKSRMLQSETEAPASEPSSIATSRV